MSQANGLRLINPVFTRRSIWQEKVAAKAVRAVMQAKVPAQGKRR
jgi:hypothetical protein